MKEELEGEPVVAKFATPKKYGRKEGYTQMQNVDYYNLDMIISVEYRVKSRNGIVFRKWANNILKQYRKQVNCTIIGVWVQVFAKSRKLHLGAMVGSKNWAVNLWRSFLIWKGFHTETRSISDNGISFIISNLQLGNKLLPN